MTRDEEKTKGQLISELGQMRQLVADLEISESERKHTSEMIGELSYAIDRSPGTIVITDIKGNIRYVNRRFSEMSGYTREEAIGQNPRFLQSGQTPPGTYKIMWQTITSGSEWRGELLNKTKDGGLYWESAIISPIKNSGGIITGFIAAKEDITERKLLEEARKEMEGELNTIFDSVPLALIVVDREYHVRKMNRFALGLAGQTAEEATGLPGGEAIRCLHHLDDPRGCGFGPSCPCAVRLAALDTLQTGSAHDQAEASLPFCLEGKETVLDVLASATPITLSGEEMVLVCMENITERKLAEEELERYRIHLEQMVEERTVEVKRTNGQLRMEITQRQQTQEELSLLLKMSQAISNSEDSEAALVIAMREICETTAWDYGEAWIPSKDGQVLECSSAWYGSADGLRNFRESSEGVTFSSGEGLPGRVWSKTESEWIPDVSMETEERFPRRRIAAESGLKAAVGIPIFVQGRVLAILVFFMFEASPEVARLVSLISAVGTQLGSAIQRRQAEEALRESEAGLREAQRIAHIGRWQLDFVANTLTWSDEIYQMFGVDPHQTAASNEVFSDLVHPDDREAVRKAYNESLRARTPYDIVHRLLLRGGTVRYVHEVCETSYDVDGKPVRSVGTVQDITELRVLESKVVEYEELNEFKTNLLSTVSHELRTPMAIIKGYATLMLDYGDQLTDTEKDEYLTSIDRATNRLTELVDHILDMSRLESGLLRLEKARSSLPRIIREAVSEAGLRAPDHSIIWKSNGRLPRVMVDARRIRQVLDNILDNAIKYSAAGTTITVSTQVAPKELLVAVIDEGVGIPREDLEKIFERMYRVENRLTQQPGGAGLGLAICKGLVEAHGGRIWMESDEGKGCTCCFTVPT